MSWPATPASGRERAVAHVTLAGDELDLAQQLILDDFPGQEDSDRPAVSTLHDAVKALYEAARLQQRALEELLR